MSLLPSAEGAKASKSSSWPDDTPLTEAEPVVEITTRPSASRATASMFSDDALSPTSLPSKYIDHVPAVVDPSDAGVNSSRS